MVLRPWERKAMKAFGYSVIGVLILWLLASFFDTERSFWLTLAEVILAALVGLICYWLAMGHATSRLNRAHPWLKEKPEATRVVPWVFMNGQWVKIDDLTDHQLELLKTLYEKQGRVFPPTPPRSDDDVDLS